MLLLASDFGDGRRYVSWRCLLKFLFGLAMLFGCEVNPHLTFGADTDRSATADAGAAKSPPNATIEAAIRDDFLVLPIRTALQRATGSKFDNAKVLVLINGVKVIKGEDEALNARALKLSKIWEAIEPFTKDEPANVVFRVWCGRYARASRDDGTWPASSILVDALGQFGRDVGFQDARVDLFFLSPHCEYAGDWKRAAGDFAMPAGGDDQLDEPAVGDQQVKIYPVRTRLSRLLYHNADCVIRIVPPVDEVDVASAIETMKRCVPQLGLTRKDQLVFLEHWKSPEIANVISDELMGKHIYQDLLGFKSVIRMAEN